MSGKDVRDRGTAAGAALPALPCPARWLSGAGRHRPFLRLPGGDGANAELQELQMFPGSQTSSWLQSWGVLRDLVPQVPPAQWPEHPQMWLGASGHRSLTHTHPPFLGVPQRSCASLSQKKITFAQVSERFSLRQKLLYVKRSPEVGKFTALVAAAAVCDQYNLNFPPKPHFTAISFHHRFHRAGGQQRGAHTCWKIHIYW